MFLVRAAFWIFVVALLLPHEPDLGLARASAAQAPHSLAAWADSAIAGAGQTCARYQAACRTGIQVLDEFQAAALVALARVKSELDEQQRARRGA